MDELTEHLMNSDEDGFWDQIQSEARREAEREPVLVELPVRLGAATSETGRCPGRDPGQQAADARPARDSASRPD